MNALRIFAHAPARRSLVRPGRVIVASPPPPEPVVEEELLDPAVERRLVNILESSPQFGETIDAAYRRKERALAEAFTVLTRADAAILERRFDQMRPEDDLAQRFARLVVERRTRLLAILADVPRRRAR